MCSIKSPAKQTTVRKSHFSKLQAVAFFALMLAAPAVFAASATWTNAPVDATWTNVNNWISKVVPGTINNTANNGTDTSSIATFTNAIPGSLIGSATIPIVPDDGTVVGGANGGAKARMLSQLNFSGANCGAYVFYSPSPYFAGVTGGNPETGVLSLCIASSAAPNNGSYINSDVVNPQTFLIPVQIRLPSSTSGVYGFTNNATSPNATYYFNNLFLYPGATGRGVTFLFAGSNTGTNTVNLLSQSANQSGSPSGLIKQGTGRWILSGANTFNAASAMIINGGTLEVQNAGAFGLASPTINSNGVLQIDGANLTASTLTLQQSGVVRANGSTTINGVTVGTVTTPTTPILATTSSGDLMTIGTAVNKVTGGASSSVLHVSGPGTVLLSYANNYVGNWSIDSGTLQIAAGATGALGTGLNVNIGAGGTLDVSPYTAGGGTYNPSPSGFGGSGTGTTVSSTAATIMADPSGFIDLATGTKTINLVYTPTSFTGDLTHPALYISQGTLSLGGNAFSINNASGSPLGAGTYKLIQQASGIISSTGGYSVIGVTGSGLVSGNVASIVVTGGEVDLVVASYVAKNLVWSGTGSAWDIATSSDWLNGVSSSVFNNSDNVILNSVGAANPNVSLVGTLSPGSVVVDTSANNYTFGGSGSIAGGASLTKLNAGTLLINSVNTYGGGTVVSNGVLQIGVNNAIPATGAGDVAIQSSGTLDLNTFSDTVNALIGSGTVDSVAGGTPVLSVGNNNNSGVFSGVIKNTAGTLGVTKVGNGVETLSGINTYSGPTVVNAGTLRVNNYNALGSGASAVTVNTAVLDLQSSVVVSTIAGAGSILNNSSATTNILVVTNTSTFNGIISDGSGGGGVGITVANGSLQLNGANTYSGGTILSSGTTLGVGPTPGGAGTGGILASNGATVASNSGGGTSSQINNNITTVSGATVQFTGGGAGADGFNGLFYGDATTTNVYHGQLTFGGGAPQFANFLGTAVFVPSATGTGNRINSGTTFVNGGDNTTFNFQGGFLFNRNATTFSIGALTGGAGSVSQDGGGIANGGSGFATYLVGAKGIDSVYSGSITGSNNIVKVGAGRLTLNGSTGLVVTTPDGGLTYVTNSVLVNTKINYAGATTISNGVLALVAPVVLTNSYNGANPTTITLASATAVLDASQMGYIATDNSTYTNLVTNGVFEVVSSQTLAGLGTIRASNVLLDAGSIFNVGLPTGVLTVTNNLELAGIVNMNLNITNSANCSEVVAQNFTIDGTATLVVTNIGPNIVNGTIFHLFNKGVGIFSSVTLPATDPTGVSAYVWNNNLTVDGTIQLASGGASPVNQTPTNIVASVSGNTLTLTWPTDHLGWTLQVQTNALNAGLGTNWVDVPGSSSVNSTNLTINPANGAVFYRMHYP